MLYFQEKREFQDDMITEKALNKLWKQIIHVPSYILDSSIVDLDRFYWPF